MSFKGRTVVIVAADIDAGHACALDFAAHGASVVMLDAQPGRLEETCQAVRAQGGDAQAVAVDPCDPDALKRAADALARPVHALVNCHMQSDRTSIEDSTPEGWRRIVETNFLGPVFATKAFLPWLKQAGDAAVVHISSFDGILGNPRVPSYSAIKGAMAPLTHVMADEFAAYGIRVNCLARGLTLPDDHPGDPYFDPIIRETPLGRGARPAEIASAVRFLASPDASYVTAAVLVVDGGRTALTPGTRWLGREGPSTPIMQMSRPGG